MVGIDLKLSFFDREQVAEFLRFLRYMEWCGNVGHSAGITVNADGDGTFKLACWMKDPETGDYKALRDIVPMGEREINQLEEEQKAWQQGILPGNRDRNEVSFCLGD